MIPYSKIHFCAMIITLLLFTGILQTFLVLLIRNNKFDVTDAFVGYHNDVVATLLFHTRKTLRGIEAQDRRYIEVSGYYCCCVRVCVCVLFCCCFWFVFVCFELPFCYLTACYK